MFRIVCKTIGLTLLVGYLAVAGFIYAVDREPARYRDCRIVLCDTAEAAFLREADIRAMMKQGGFVPQGQEIATFDTHALALHLEQNRLVRHAYCYHTPDSTLRIDIYQRKPILRVKTDGGRDFYVDSEGEIMPVRADAPAIRLPLATGRITEDFARTALYDFARYLEDNRFWRANITQICVGGQEEVELVPRVGDHVIYLGPMTGYRDKLSRLRTFYDKALPRKGWNAYRRINLKFDGQVICEKNP